MISVQQVKATRVNGLWQLQTPHHKHYSLTLLQVKTPFLAVATQTAPLPSTHLRDTNKPSWEKCIKSYLVDCICLVVSGSSNILTIGSVSAWSCFSCATTVVLFSRKAGKKKKTFHTQIEFLQKLTCNHMVLTAHLNRFSSNSYLACPFKEVAKPEIPKNSLA